MSRVCLWLLVGRPEHGRDSSFVRIQALPAHRALLERGWDSRIAYYPKDEELPSEEEIAERLEGVELVVMVKLREPAGGAWARAVKARGLPLVYVSNQVLSTLAHEPFAYADELVCASGNAAFLAGAALHDQRFASDSFTVIPDPLDDWLPDYADCRDEPGKEKRLLWIGRERHLESLEPFRTALPDGWRLLAISNGGDCDLLWEPERAALELARCQALLITAGADSRSSSPIRLLNGLACGKPTLAPPLDAYRELAAPAEGWLAIERPGELRAALERLSDDGERRRLGEKARVLGLKLQPPDPVPAWLALLERVYGNRVRPSTSA